MILREKSDNGTGKLKQVFSGIHEAFLCTHQHQRITPLPQGLLGPSVILYTTLPARPISQSLQLPNACKNDKKKKKKLVSGSDFYAAEF